MKRRWTIRPDHYDTPVIRSEDGRIVCFMPKVNTAAEVYERTANADLIARAPELAAAAEAYLKRPTEETLAALEKVLNAVR